MREEMNVDPAPRRGDAAVVWHPDRKEHLDDEVGELFLEEKPISPEQLKTQFAASPAWYGHLLSARIACAWVIVTSTCDPQWLITITLTKMFQVGEGPHQEGRMYS